MPGIQHACRGRPGLISDGRRRWTPGILINIAMGYVEIFLDQILSNLYCHNNLIVSLLIQSGGGTGPMKPGNPDQPVVGANSGRTEGSSR